MVIDFREITTSQEFENFAMLFLRYKGSNTYEVPGVGADGGKDIICEDSTNHTYHGYKWLVSCKHKAHGGGSVGVSVDSADANKLIQHRCHGFIFFYSTDISEGLKTEIKQICSNVTNRPLAVIYNAADIQNELLSSPYYYPLILQYFPESYQRLIGSFGQRPECCPNAGCFSMDIYAVYTRNQSTYQITPMIIGECCIHSYIEHLKAQGIEYGVATIQHAAT